jgi:hypothetical protein
MDYFSPQEIPESNPSTAVSDDELIQQVEDETVPRNSWTPPTPGSPPGHSVLTEPRGTDILGGLQRLHADELTWLAQRKRPVVNPGDRYFSRVRTRAFVAPRDEYTKSMS